MTQNDQTAPVPDENLAVTRDGAEEHRYLLKRVRDHLQLAENAEDTGTRSIHLRLAGLYDARAGALELVQPD